MVRLKLAAGLLTMVLATSSCGSEPSATVEGGSSPPTSADEQPVPSPEHTSTTRDVLDCAPPGCMAIGWSDFVHNSVGAVVGTVESVTAPRWNQASGEPWDDLVESHPGNPYAGAIQYRDATVRVEEVLFQDPGEDFAGGEVLTLRLLGDGTPTGPEYEEGFYQNQRDGDAIVGSRVAWVLWRVEFHWKERVEYPLGVASFLGNWRIDGDTAVNRLPERTVPLGPLMAAIKRESNSPRRPGDMRGAKNPLE